MLTADSIEVLRLSDLYRAVAEHIIAALEHGIEERGSATLVLAGGTTFKPIYELLASPRYMKQLDWSKVVVFFGDERCVGPQDPRSNYKMVYDALLFVWRDGSGPSVYRMEGELDPTKARDGYARILADYSIFDCVLLGVGSDGHTASLFTRNRMSWENSRDAVLIQESGMEPWVNRLTLTPYMLGKSYQTLIVATGNNKKTVINQLLTDSEGLLPISHVSAQHGKTILFLDPELASEM